jgi:hypothetical protein
VNLERLHVSFLAMVAAELAEEARELEAERLDAVAAAATEVNRLGADARATGERDAATEAQLLVARARREAHADALAAQTETYAELQAAALAAALALRGSSRYPRLLDRLAADVKSQLGAGTTMDVDPDPGGGVIGRDGSRLVDCSLPTLARRCLAALGPELEVLWW